LQEWQSNAGAILGSVDTAGNAAFQNANYAGKNYIINGDFDIWQRGTSFSVGGGFMYTADRWYCYRQSLSTGMTVSRQAAIATGSTFSARIQRDSGNSSTSQLWLEHNIESSNSTNLAGKTITISFSARAGANFSSSGNTLSLGIFTGTGTDQRISGGMTGVISTIFNAALTTSTQRFNVTVTIPTNATQVCLQFFYLPQGTAGAADFYEIDQVQLEVGTVATPFSRAGGTIQGELAACQRYYFRSTGTTNFAPHTGFGIANNSTNAAIRAQLPVVMRTTPTSVDFSTLRVTDAFSGTFTVNSITIGEGGPAMLGLTAVVSSGLTTGRAYSIENNNNAAGFIGFSAEL
jgi:hypothetical protein